jgi:hypothetical protein
MTAFLIIVWMVIGAVAGVFCVGELSGIPAREGQAAIYGVMVGGPLGLVAGFAVGFAIARALSDNPERKRIVSIISLLLIVVPAVGGFVYESWRTRDWLDNSGQSRALAYRIRFPDGAATPAGMSAGFELRSDKENVACSTYDAPHGLTQQQGRWVLSGECRLRFATPQRELWVRIAGGPNLIFRLRLKARYEVVPYSVSAWYPVDEVLDAAPGSRRRAPKPEEAGYEILLSAR